MEHNSINNSGWTIQDIIKGISAVAIGVSTLCFILGLLIVNLRLSNYGVYSADFIRKEYILVGAVFSILLTIAYIFLDVIFKQVKLLRFLWSEKRYFSFIFRFVILLFFTFLTPDLLHPFSDVGAGDFGNYLSSFREMLIAISPFFAILLPINLFVSPHLSELFRKIKSKHLDVEMFRNTAYGILWSIPVLLGGLELYSEFTYPIISTAYGGGKIAPSILTPTPLGLEICKSLSLPIKNNQSIGPIEVLTESEHEIIILAQDKTSEKKYAIRLNRELFEAVQIMPR